MKLFMGWTPLPDSNKRVRMRFFHLCRHFRQQDSKKHLKSASVKINRHNYGGQTKRIAQNWTGRINCFRQPRIGAATSACGGRAGAIGGIGSEYTKEKSRVDVVQAALFRQLRE